jgi:hypothetical protein
MPAPPAPPARTRQPEYMALRPWSLKGVAAPHAPFPPGLAKTNFVPERPAPRKWGAPPGSIPRCWGLAPRCSPLANCHLPPLLAASPATPGTITWLAVGRSRPPRLLTPIDAPALLRQPERLTGPQGPSQGFLPQQTVTLRLPCTSALTHRTGVFVCTIKSRPRLGPATPFSPGRTCHPKATHDARLSQLFRATPYAWPQGAASSHER